MPPLCTSLSCSGASTNLCSARETSSTAKVTHAYRRSVHLGRPDDVRSKVFGLGFPWQVTRLHAAAVCGSNPDSLIQSRRLASDQSSFKPVGEKAGWLVPVWRQTCEALPTPARQGSCSRISGWYLVYQAVGRLWISASSSPTSSGSHSASALGLPCASRCQPWPSARSGGAKSAEENSLMASMNRDLMRIGGKGFVRRRNIRGVSQCMMKRSPSLRCTSKVL
mmetsp:Transcript_17059/g.48764  ORF Transcript_17059/g.48764 Transcript_17059/m.48764 type:complete len:223 (+) Transcript_17059:700-1368(+)